MLSVQGATSGQQVPGVLCHISNHAPRAGSDSFVLLSRSRNFTFQSTLPVRGATIAGELRAGHIQAFQSTLPVRGATETCAYTARYTAKFQSTLPVRGATGDKAKFRRTAVFQSTLPVRGATIRTGPGSCSSTTFQSTLPVRGATRHILCHFRPPVYFNPRSPCGERPFAPMFRAAMYYFNPRSPCGERLPALISSASFSSFQSTLPVRGATAKMPKTEPFILSNFHNFKKYTDRTRTKVIIKMELWINLSPFSGANRTGNLWSLLLRTLKGS